MKTRAPFLNNIDGYIYRKHYAKLSIDTGITLPLILNGKAHPAS
jgi:hypothetical protein